MTKTLTYVAIASYVPVLLSSLNIVHMEVSDRWLAVAAVFTLASFVCVGLLTAFGSPEDIALFFGRSSKVSRDLLSEKKGRRQLIAARALGIFSIGFALLLAFLAFHGYITDMLQHYSRR
jgi:hypothetical protein